MVESTLAMVTMPCFSIDFSVALFVACAATFAAGKIRHVNKIAAVVRK